MYIQGEDDFSCYKRTIYCSCNSQLRSPNTPNRAAILSPDHHPLHTPVVRFASHPLKASKDLSLSFCTALFCPSPNNSTRALRNWGERWRGGRRENMQLISTDRWHLVTSSDRWHLVMSSDRWHLMTSTDRWHLVTSNDSKKCHAGPGGGCSRTTLSSTLTLTHSLTNSLTHSLAHTHSHSHTLTHSLTQSSSSHQWTCGTSFLSGFVLGMAVRTAIAWRSTKVLRSVKVDTHTCIPYT